MWIVRALPMLALVLAASPLGAQVNVQAEQRVRITAPSAGLIAPTAGQVIGVSGDTVLLQVSAAQLFVPMAAISRVEVSRGRNRLPTAILGALAGTAGGMAAAKRMDRDAGVDRVIEPCEFSPECPSEIHVMEVDRFGARERARATAIGTVLGLGVGLLLAPERWKRVPLYAGSPAAGRGELAVRVSF